MRSGAATSPKVDDTLITRPWPESWSGWAAARQASQGPVTFTVSDSSNSSRPRSPMAPRTRIPALLTRMSSPPKHSTTPATAASTESVSVYSIATASALPPVAAAISSALACASRSERLVTATLAPA